MVNILSRIRLSNVDYGRMIDWILLRVVYPSQGTLSNQPYRSAILINGNQTSMKRNLLNYFDDKVTGKTSSWAFKTELVVRYCQI